MARVDLEKLKILSRFVGVTLADESEGPETASTDRPERGDRPDPAQIEDDLAPMSADAGGSPEERTIPLIPLEDLHAMLAERVSVEAVLEALAEICDPSSAHHIEPILVNGTASERSAAERALQAILERSRQT